jgi:hypothetical protein
MQQQTLAEYDVLNTEDFYRRFKYGAIAGFVNQLA